MQNDRPAERLEYETPTGRRRGYLSVAVKAGVAAVVLALVIVVIAGLLPHADFPSARTMRVICANHLRELGRAAVLYANMNNMKMPDDLKTLFDANDLNSYVLVCPASNLPEVAGTTTQAADLAIKTGQVSYIYIGKGLRVDAPADTVLMYEPLADHEDGMNVLFVDAHVEWLDLAKAKKLIARINSGQNPVRYPDPASATQP